MLRSLQRFGVGKNVRRQRSRSFSYLIVHCSVDRSDVPKPWQTLTGMARLPPADLVGCPKFKAPKSREALQCIAPPVVNFTSGRQRHSVKETTPLHHAPLPKKHIQSTSAPFPASQTPNWPSPKAHRVSVQMLSRAAVRATTRVAGRRGFHATRSQMSSPYHYPEGPYTNIPFDPKKKTFPLLFWGFCAAGFSAPFLIASASCLPTPGPFLPAAAAALLCWLFLLLQGSEREMRYGEDVRRLLTFCPHYSLANLQAQGIDGVWAGIG